MQHSPQAARRDETDSLLARDALRLTYVEDLDGQLTAMSDIVWGCCDRVGDHATSALALKEDIPAGQVIDLVSAPVGHEWIPDRAAGRLLGVVSCGLR